MAGERRKPFHLFLNLLSQFDAARGGDFASRRARTQISVDESRQQETGHRPGSYVRIYRREPDGAWQTVPEINTTSPSDIPYFR